MNTNAHDQGHHGRPWWDGDHSFQDGVVATPDTFVLGHTIADWTENFWRSAVQAPAGAGPLDSASLNRPSGKMTFIAFDSGTGGCPMPLYRRQRRARSCSR